jgi:HK97 gp10 family phage protein
MGYSEQGVDKLAQRMLLTAKYMQQTAARRAVRAGGQVIGTAMTERTPEQETRSLGSDSLEIGELKENIKVRTTIRDGMQTALIGPVGKGGKIARAAHLVEYGHRMVTGGKSKLDAAGVLRGGGKVHAVDVPPHPFLRPAFESSRVAAMDAMAETLKVELGEAVKL